MADAAMFANHGVGVGEKIVSDPRAAIDGHEAVQHGVLPDLDVFVNETKGPHVRSSAQFRGRGDHRRGVNARGIMRRGMEELDGPREIEIRVLRA